MNNKRKHLLIFAAKFFLPLKYYPIKDVLRNYHLMRMRQGLKKENALSLNETLGFNLSRKWIKDLFYDPLFQFSLLELDLRLPMRCNITECLHLKNKTTFVRDDIKSSEKIPI